MCMWKCFCICVSKRESEREREREGEREREREGEREREEREREMKWKKVFRAEVNNLKCCRLSFKYCEIQLQNNCLICWEQRAETCPEKKVEKKIVMCTSIQSRNYWFNANEKWKKNNQSSYKNFFRMITGLGFLKVGKIFSWVLIQQEPILALEYPWCTNTK